jgi:phenylalanyl-tRNA synthetase beta chain
MKLSLRWLRELVDLSGLGAAEVADTLTFHVAEVEDVVSVGAALDAVKTARVLTAARHPQADRLSVCTVDAGDGVVRTVVCGAPNVAAGQVICHAPVGTTLPNGVTLSRRAIRGVDSDGMICAEDEMGLGKDHDGILVLDPTTPLGRPVSEALGLRDEVLEVNNTAITHRPDLWGHVGFARELAAVLNRKLTLPGRAAAEAAFAAATGPAPAVAIDDPEGCRRYVGLSLTGLSNGPSPQPIKRRLEALGVRSVDLLVDLTQWVMLEQGQPLHAFDARALTGAVRVRRAGTGERLKTLDGQERALTPEDLVIADARAALAVAGVMGGAESAVRGDTSAVLLEAACFDAVRIRRTSARLGLRTDASTRFEKSLDPEGTWTSALRFVELVLAHVPSARAAGRPADVGRGPVAPREIELPYERVRRRLGVRVGDFESRARLLALGFGCTEGRDGLLVTVPSWRARDVTCSEDLVEEVGRTRGYADVPSVAPVLPMHPTRPPPARALERRAAAVLSLELGYAQTTCYSFYGAEAAGRLGLAATKHVMLANPLGAEQDRLELTTLPNLLLAVARNQAQEARGRLWESTRLLPPAPIAGRLPAEVPVLAAVTWDRDGDDPTGRQFRDALEDLRVLFLRLGVPAPLLTEGAAALAPGLPRPTWLHPGRAAVVRVAGSEVLAVVGEVAPAIRRAFGLEGRVVHAEISAVALLDAAQAAGPEYAPVNRFPVAPFDVAVIVPRRTPAARVVDAITQAAPGHVRGVRVFDVYEGAGIPAGQRSLALACDLFDPAGTLSPRTAEDLRRKVRAALDAAGWTVRAGDVPSAG